jgi:hypothetical protein
MGILRSEESGAGPQREPVELEGWQEKCRDKYQGPSVPRPAARRNAAPSPSFGTRHPSPRSERRTPCARQSLGLGEMM